MKKIRDAYLSDGQAYVQNSIFLVPIKYTLVYCASAPDVLGCKTH